MDQQLFKFNYFRIIILLACLIYIMTLSDSTSIHAQEPQKNIINNKAEKDLTPKEKEAQKEKEVKTGFILLGGIAFICGFAIFLMMVWGYRVRKVIREPLAPCKEPDPLWYLKSKNKNPSENSNTPVDIDNNNSGNKNQEE